MSRTVSFAITARGLYNLVSPDAVNAVIYGSRRSWFMGQVVSTINDRMKRKPDNICQGKLIIIIYNFSVDVVAETSLQ